MSTFDPDPFVVAIVATCRRSALLGKMLASLRSVSAPLAVMVVDNGNDLETEAVVCAMQGLLEVTRLVPGTNLGCGGGLEYGERAALERYPSATHFWIMDDDTEVAPQALERMLAAMREQGAIAACPTILDQEGRMNWFPGLLDSKTFQIARQRPLPAEYLARCGSAPVRFSWACGVSFLITREALERLGLHRVDFWVRGEDIEFSLRLTYRDVGVFVPQAVVSHVFPLSQTTPEAIAMERKKELSMLRNHAYTALHLPHGRRILRSLPGNFWRYLKNFGVRELGSGICAMWMGGVLKRPSGVEPKVFEG